MDDSNGTARLLAGVEQAFPAEPRPKDERLVGHVCSECDGLRAVVQGMRWTDLADVLVDENFDKLPLLTPEAFCYFVPAYIRRAVRDPVEAGLGFSKVLEFTVYSLCDRELPADRWWCERVGRFTPKQEHIIAEFLKWVVRTGEELELDDFEIDDARRGLEKYWNARAASQSEKDGA
jgi:hypothetical protein